MILRMYNIIHSKDHFTVHEICLMEAFIKALHEYNNTAKKQYIYGCVMAHLPDSFRKQLTNWNLENIQDFELAFEDGRELWPHITVLYGLTKWNKQVRADIDEALRKINSFKVDVKDLTIFRTNPDHDVLVLKVQSKELVDLHERLRIQFPSKVTHVYSPHITIAYLKKGAGEKYLNQTIVPTITVTLNKYRVTFPQKKTVEVDNNIFKFNNLYNSFIGILKKSINNYQTKNLDSETTPTEDNTPEVKTPKPVKPVSQPKPKKTPTPIDTTTENATEIPKQQEANAEQDNKPVATPTVKPSPLRNRVKQELPKVESGVQSQAQILNQQRRHNQYIKESDLNTDSKVVPYDVWEKEFISNAKQNQKVAIAPIKEDIFENEEKIKQKQDYIDWWSNPDNYPTNISTNNVLSVVKGTIERYKQDIINYRNIIAQRNQDLEIVNAQYNWDEDRLKLEYNNYIDIMKNDFTPSTFENIKQYLANDKNFLNTLKEKYDITSQDEINEEFVGFFKKYLSSAFGNELLAWDGQSLGSLPEINLLNSDLLYNAFYEYLDNTMLASSRSDDMYDKLEDYYNKILDWKTKYPKLFTTTYSKFLTELPPVQDRDIGQLVESKPWKRFMSYLRGNQYTKSLADRIEQYKHDHDTQISISKEQIEDIDQLNILLENELVTNNGNEGITVRLPMKYGTYLQIELENAFSNDPYVTEEEKEELIEQWNQNLGINKLKDQFARYV